MSRVGSTVSSCQIARTPLLNGDATIIENTTSSLSSSAISSRITEHSYSNSHVSVSSHDTSQSTEIPSSSLDLSTTVLHTEESSRSGVILNGNLNQEAAVPKMEATASETSLCEGLSQVSLIENKFNGVDGASFSCEVSVSNSSNSQQIVQLANGLGRLTVEESDSNVEKSNGSAQVCGASGGNVDSTDSPGINDCTTEMSSTFTVILPSPGSISNNCSVNKTVKEESDSVSPRLEGKDNVKHIEAGMTDDLKVNHVHLSPPDQDKQVPSTPQNVLKAKQEYLKEARTYSMSTLSPR